MDFSNKEHLDRVSRGAANMLRGGHGLSDVFRFLQRELGRPNAAFLAVIVLMRISSLTIGEAKFATVWHGFDAKYGMSDEALDAKYLELVLEGLKLDLDFGQAGRDAPETSTGKIQ